MFGSSFWRERRPHFTIRLTQVFYIIHPQRKYSDCLLYYDSFIYNTLNCGLKSKQSFTGERNIERKQFPCCNHVELLTCLHKLFTLYVLTQRTTGEEHRKTFFLRLFYHINPKQHFRYTQLPHPPCCQSRPAVLIWTLCVFGQLMVGRINRSDWEVMLEHSTWMTTRDHFWSLIMSPHGRQTPGCIQRFFLFFLIFKSLHQGHLSVKSNNLCQKRTWLKHNGELIYFWFI